MKFHWVGASDDNVNEKEMNKGEGGRGRTRRMKRQADRAAVGRVRRQCSAAFFYVPVIEWLVRLLAMAIDAS